MIPITVDANIFISALSADESAECQSQILKKIIEEKYLVWVPSLLPFEVISVLNRKVKDGLIDESNLERLISGFYRLPLLMVWNEALMTTAHGLQRKGLKTIYDASYLALASIKQIPLISEDKELLTKGKKLYSNVYSAAAFVEAFN